jgi:hypothetical protein
VENSTGSSSIFGNRTASPSRAVFLTRNALTMISQGTAKSSCCPCAAWAGAITFGIHYCGPTHRFAAPYAKVPRLDFLDGVGGIASAGHLPTLFEYPAAVELVNQTLNKFNTVGDWLPTR